MDSISLPSAFLAKAEGSTKKTAEATCAFFLMRQLFYNKLVGAYTGEKKKKTARNVGLNEKILSV